MSDLRFPLLKIKSQVFRDVMLYDLVTLTLQNSGKYSSNDMMSHTSNSGLQQEGNSIQDTKIILSASVNVQIVALCHTSRSAKDQQRSKDTTPPTTSFKSCNLTYFLNTIPLHRRVCVPLFNQLCLI